MKLTYDPNYNIGYIAFRNKTANVQTIHLSEEVNIDISADGTIYGIELLNANEQLATGPLHKLIIENAATGKSTEIELSA